MDLNTMKKQKNVNVQKINFGQEKVVLHAIYQNILIWLKSSVKIVKKEKVLTLKKEYVWKFDLS